MLAKMKFSSRIQAILLVAFIYPALMVESLVRHYNFRVSTFIEELTGKPRTSFSLKFLYLDMQVVLKSTTKLCSSKAILTVNGKFPGPTLYAREDDTVIIRVTNHGNRNVTIHW